MYRFDEALEILQLLSEALSEAAVDPANMEENDFSTSENTDVSNLEL